MNNNNNRLALIKTRNKRYGIKCICPNCKNMWWHEDEDYIVSDITYVKKLQCPYCKTIFESEG